MMRLLCISGKRGTGKTLLAKYLGEYGYKKASLAEDLKERCKRDFGLIEDQVNGVFKEQPTQYRRTDGSFLTPRDILIRMGVFYRSIDPLFWCKKLVLDDRVVIDDIRFINEVKYFKKLGGQFIRIERDAEDNPYKAALDDLSETELDSYKDWDFILKAENNKTSDDLKQFANYIEAHFK